MFWHVLECNKLNPLDALPNEKESAMQDDPNRFFKESFEATMRFAELAVRSLLILNGGAALGLLTFASNQNKNGSAPINYTDAVWLFGIGAALAVLTAGLAYLAQYFFTHENDDWKKKTANTLQIGAVVAWLVSMGFFVGGVRAAVAVVAN
jgi:hypothetical protein